MKISEVGSAGWGILILFLLVQVDVVGQMTHQVLIPEKDFNADVSDYEWPLIFHFGALEPDSSLRNESMEIMESELQMYNGFGKLKKANLEVVLVSSILQIDESGSDIECGISLGTYYIDLYNSYKIYVVAEEDSRTTLHHELSSVLMYYVMNKNNRGLKYVKDLRKKFIAYSFYEEDYDCLGFEYDHKMFLGLTDYSVSSWENDFNTIAEYLFYPIPVYYEGKVMPFWTFMDYARENGFPISRKVDAAIDFYHRWVSKELDEDIFRSLEKDLMAKPHYQDWVSFIGERFRDEAEVDNEYDNEGKVTE